MANQSSFGKLTHGELRQRYDDRLVYVRYRYDEERKKRVTTVELIIDEAEWDQQRKLWELCYENMIELEIQDRVVRLKSSS